MNEPTVTINLREYEELLRMSRSRSLGLIEIVVDTPWHSRSYFMPQNVANEQMMDDMKAIKEALRYSADALTALRTYTRLPWYRRIFANPPKA